MEKTEKNKYLVMFFDMSSFFIMIYDLIIETGGGKHM